MRKLFFPILILLLALPTLLPFFQKGFFWTQDIIFLSRIYAAFQALADGQFPLRWVSVFRYGEPLFNYYAPLPYYLGAIIHSLGFDYITTAKVLFITITFLSAFFMFLLTKESWGILGGIASALLYLFAPYRAVDLYIRGAFSEIFALMLFPLTLLCYLQFTQAKQSTSFLLATLSLAALILAHNIMALIFFPFFTLYLFYQLVLKSNQTPKFHVLASVGLALGLAASYWIPALLEQDLVQTKRTVLSLDNFVNQFVKFEEFIKPSWDGFIITHELGYTGIILGMLTIITSLYFLKRQRKQATFIFLLLLSFSFSIFLQTNLSLQLWLVLPLIEFVQFPWRVSAISMFLLSFLGGGFFWFLKKYTHLSTVSLALVIFLTIFSQSHYFRTQNPRPTATDKDLIILEDAYLPKEYMPRGVKENPPQPIKEPVDAHTLALLEIQNLKQRSTSYSFDLNTNKEQEILVPIYYFPKWEATSEEGQIEVKKQPKTGLILIPVKPGEQHISLKLKDTTTRQISNLISFLSLLLLIFFSFSLQRKSSTKLENIS